MRKERFARIKRIETKVKLNEKNVLRRASGETNC